MFFFLSKVKLYMELDFDGVMCISLKYLSSGLSRGQNKGCMQNLQPQ
jgi:hypothetical protein